MAHAQFAVNANFSTFKNEFYVTASPALREWSIAGGRYSVINECVSRSIDNDIQVVDLKEHDYIVFIGQFLQPKRLFRSGEIYSKSVIKKSVRACGYPVYQPGDFYNEPLELFPRLAPGRCTIFSTLCQFMEFILPVLRSFLMRLGISAIRMQLSLSFSQCIHSMVSCKP